MIKSIVKDVVFPGQVSEPSTKDDAQIRNKYRFEGMETVSVNLNDLSDRASLEIEVLKRKYDASVPGFGYRGVFCF